MFKLLRPLVLLMVSLLTACASTPSGPSWMALPGSGKSFDQFRNDDYQCRQFAHERASGVYLENYSDFVNQQRYDNSYLECMYAKGHRVPVFGQILEGSTKIGNRDQSGNIPPPLSEEPQPSPPNYGS